MWWNYFSRKSTNIKKWGQSEGEKKIIQFFLLPQSSTKISEKQNQQDLYYLALGVIVFQGEGVRMGPQRFPIFYEPNLIEFYEILDICELHLECSILVASNLNFKGKKAQESKRWTSLTYIQCTPKKFWHQVKFATFNMFMACDSCFQLSGIINWTVC